MTLCCAAWGITEWQTPILEAGGVERVVAAMAAHEAPDVQALGVSVFAGLCGKTGASLCDRCNDCVVDSLCGVALCARRRLWWQGCVHVCEVTASAAQPWHRQRSSMHGTRGGGRRRTRGCCDGGACGERRIATARVLGAGTRGGARRYVQAPSPAATVGGVHNRSMQRRTQATSTTLANALMWLAVAVCQPFNLTTTPGHCLCVPQNDGRKLWRLAALSAWWQQWLSMPGLRHCNRAGAPYLQAFAPTTAVRDELLGCRR